MIGQGHEVLAIDNLSFGRREQLNPRADFWEVDLGLVDGNLLTERLANFGPSHMIHLAAIHFIPYCIEHPEETFASNVRSTEALVRAAAAGRTLRRLLVASTMDVYAPSDSVHRQVRLTVQRVPFERKACGGREGIRERANVVDRQL